MKTINSANHIRKPALDGNPWGLTQNQSEIASALIKYPSNKELARGLDLTMAAVSDRLKIACRKMGVRSKVQVAVLYDRFARAAGPCANAKFGWTCARETGHEGPCVTAEQAKGVPAP